MTTDPADAAALGYLYQRANIFLVITDRQGTVLRANAHAGAVLERSPIGLNFRELLVDFIVARPFADLVAGSGGAQMLNITRVTGAPLTLGFSFIDRGPQILIIGEHDIAELARLQREVLGLNQESNDLARALQKSNAELVQLNQLKNQFLGMAAHDLRKPTGVVMSISQILLEDLADVVSPRQVEFLQYVYQASREMARLINDFLDISIIESGKLELRLASIRPADLLRESLKFIGPVAAKKNVELVIDCASDLPWLTIDAPKVGQVIANLALNAVEHSPTGSSVWITCQSAAEGLVFAVCDHGSGISLEKLPHLFRPFVPGDAVKSAGERGVGLGLVIARKIVEQHGGRIWAENNSGRGAVFRFLLPLPVVQKQRA